MLMSSSSDEERRREERRREVRALSELGLTEISKASEGIHDTHRAISDRVFRIVRLGLGPTVLPVKVIHDLITDGVYKTISVSTRAAGWASGKVADLPMEYAPSETVYGAGIIGAVNGLIGDELADARSPLAATDDDGMTVREDGLAVPVTRTRLAEAFPTATGRIAIFVHGLVETEHVWWYRADRSYGEHLADAHDITPVYLRYNTGRRISHNGRTMAALINDLVRDWPTPVTDISLIGHSMGGLVARSAAHHAVAAGMSWPALVGATISLGTPHAGAPLENIAHHGAALLEKLPETEAFARLLRRRSGGIRDLRAGSLVDTDWSGRDPEDLGKVIAAEIPLLPDTRHYFASATVTRSPTHPIGRLIGDGLVMHTSASGTHRARRIEFDPGNGVHVGRAHHFTLLSHPEIAESLTLWLGPDAPTVFVVASDGTIDAPKGFTTPRRQRPTRTVGLPVTPDAAAPDGTAPEDTAPETPDAETESPETGTPDAEAPEPAAPDSAASESAPAPEADAFDRFTAAACDAVIAAQDIARAARNEAITPGHLTLGLLGDPDSRAVKLLAAQGIEPSAVRAAVVVTPGDGEPDEVLPLEDATRAVFELTFREAVLLGHDYIGTEHLLLALVEAEDDGGPLHRLGVVGIRLRADVAAPPAPEVPTTVS